jgi:serine/threonine protein kinase
MVDSSLAYATVLEALAAHDLVSESELASAASEAGGDPQTLARLLVSRGLLTEFQASAVLEGRTASLRVGNYELLDRIGAGGMGTVFKARHRRMKRIVALKVLSPEVLRNPLSIKRFQREVETIACLGHPNIVMAYDADEAELGHFLVMEFVQGRDTAGWVERDGPFSVKKAVDIVQQAARGLAYAHEQEIVHRDIKPHNLLLDEHGMVKLTDLGLARLSHEAEGTISPAGAAVTSAGGVLGTVDYMPPEQALDSTAIDQRADIYSLGCTLHFLLTGRAPYGGSTLVAILLKHRDAPIPSLSAVRPDVPARLDQLFQRMLAKKPQQRIQTMAEVVAELDVVTRELVEPDPAGGEKSVFGKVTETGGEQGVGSSSTMAMSRQPMMTVVLPSLAESRSVLIVEPSRVQASIMGNYLQELSLPVCGVAKNGTEALEQIRRQVPRAVICGLHLSDMTGLDLASQIRAEMEIQAPGFVLVTSEADEVAENTLVQLRRVLPLSKPFTQQQLRAALECVMAATSIESPLGAQLMATALPAESKSVDLTSKFAGATRPSRGDARVLLVDDSRAARKHIQAGLERQGFRHFVEVADGAQAIAMSARELCDLIVTDYNMPLMDGRALVSYLKQNPPTRHIPIIMVTTESDPRLLDPVRRMGVAGILPKQFPDELVGPLLANLF